MWRVAERIIVAVAVVLLISSGIVFYKYITTGGGEGGSSGYLLERIEEQALQIAQLEHALEVLRQATALTSEGLPSAIAATALEDLTTRVMSIETTLRIEPEQALALPLIQQDLIRIENELDLLQFANSSTLTTMYGLFSLLAALIILVIGLLFGPMVSSRIARIRERSSEQADM